VEASQAPGFSGTPCSGHCSRAATSASWASSSARPNPAFVSWPSAGYFPSTIEPSGRWSLSAGNRGVSFSRSTVAVYRNGHRISASKLRVENGYAQPTMAFNIPASQARSGAYTVVVRGIRAGSHWYTHTYHVSMFTPSH